MGVFELVRMRPTRPSSVVLQPRFSSEALAEYKTLAESVNIRVPGLFRSEFEEFLHKMDWPVYNLEEVIRYMNRIARRDNPANLGWTWKPLRTEDRNRLSDITFGTGSRSVDGKVRKRASNFWDPGQCFEVYDRPVPRHAVEKIAAIYKDERLRERVGFLVSDYTTKLHEVIQTPRLPDPFLMAVVVDRKNDSHFARYVIDFWDEPGFGIESQIK